MSDEREILRDLQCFDDSARRLPPPPILQPESSSSGKGSGSGEGLTKFEENKLALVPETIDEKAHASLDHVSEVAYDSVNSGQPQRPVNIK